MQKPSVASLRSDRHAPESVIGMASESWSPWLRNTWSTSSE